MPALARPRGRGPAWWQEDDIYPATPASSINYEAKTASADSRWDGRFPERGRHETMGRKLMDSETSWHLDAVRTVQRTHVA